MASFDPSVIGSIADGAGDPVGAMARGISIKDMLDREQLNALQTGAAKQQSAEDSQVKDILKNSKYDTPDGLVATAEKVNRVSPRAAMDLLQTGQKYQSGQIQNQLDQWSLVEKRAEMVFSEFDPIRAQAQDIKNKGGSDMDANAYIAQQLPQVIQRLRSQKGPDGKPILPDEGLREATSQPMTLARLTALDARAKQGLESIKAQKEQFQADTQAKAENVRQGQADTQARSEQERERADRVKEAQADRRIAATSGGFTPEIGELQAAMAERGVALPAGMRSRQQMVSAFNGLLERNPSLTPDEIAEKVAKGQIEFGAQKKETQTAAATAGKVEVAQNEIQEFVPLVREAAAKVPRGQFVPWTKLKQMASANISNPNLRALKIRINSLLNAYDMLAARGGTDKDKRAEVRSLIETADSPEVLEAGLNSFLLEADAAHRAAVKATRVPELPDNETPPAAAPSPASQGAAPGGSPGAPATGPLQPGNVVKHKSGATVEILEQ